MSLIPHHETTWSKWRRRFFNFRLLLDQFLMILDLPTLSTSLELRMKRLRHIYYLDAKVNMSYRRVRDIVRGHLDKTYFGYYERLLSVERATYQIGQKLPHGNDLLYQIQRLGDKIARLIEELQDLDRLAKLYPNADSPEAQNIQAARQSLVQKIEEALAIQGGIPARMMSFGTAKAERGIEKLQMSLQRLALQLDDIADTYDEMDDFTETFEGGRLSRLGDVESS